MIAGLMTAGQLVAFLELYLQFVKRGFRVPQLINSVQAGGVAYRRLKPLLAPALSVAGEPRRAFQPGYVAGLERGAAVALTSNGTAKEPAGRVLVGGTDGANGPPGALPASGGASRRGTGRRRVDLATSPSAIEAPGRPSLADLTLSIGGALVGVTRRRRLGEERAGEGAGRAVPARRRRDSRERPPPSALDAEERAALIGYLPQDPWLFSGTVRENVVSAPRGWGMRRQIWRRWTTWWRGRFGWRRSSQTSRRSRRLDTPIGEGGVRVSGGQRQRIALARALLAARGSFPGLLVLDDPFSAVDVDTEVRLVEGLLRAVRPGRRRPGACDDRALLAAGGVHARSTSSSCSTTGRSSRSGRTPSGWRLRPVRPDLPGPAADRAGRTAVESRR